MATQNNYITVAYKLYAKDADSETEDLMEECGKEHPFVFISNLGFTLPAFEKEIQALTKGDKFDFTIPCAEAYGEFNDELMFDVDKSIFKIDGHFDSSYIYEGNVITMASSDGQPFNATVIEVKDDAVTIDLNHPRAGMDLHFIGEVIDNREATNAEITDMINYASGEGCGCGGCGGGCGDGGCCGGCH